MPTAIIWFRQDLRLDDNPAIAAALKKGYSVLPLYLWSSEEEGEWKPGGATRWWLHQSLSRLQESLEARSHRLIVREGAALPSLLDLCASYGAAAVYWNRRYEPAAIARDKEVKEGLAACGIEAESFNGSLLFEPWEIRTGSGTPYKIFTPFSRNCRARGIPGLGEGVTQLGAPPSNWPESLPLAALKLEPQIDWAGGIRAAWEPGEEGARRVLRSHLEETLTDYDATRDLPGIKGTSRLSPYLHFGEISPVRVWAEVQRSIGKKKTRGVEVYEQQLLWREFGHHLLFHFPRSVDQPLREEFTRFPWLTDQHALRSWQRGMTGYPIVDAGMRELWSTGWMHNRVRMIVASFLVKHLLIPWQEGARWFWDTLVDADLANNTLGWQWTAGSGADAAPYFRIFNPISQGTKFDPDGSYVRRWCPELERMPKKWIHSPWEASPLELAAAKVRLGIDYPAPIVDHQEARGRALEAYEELSAAG